MGTTPGNRGLPFRGFAFSVESLTRALWRARRLTDRAAWTRRLLRRSEAADDEDAPGLLILQIDGLARAVLLDALADGTMPHLRGLVDDEGYSAHALYPGLPASTPAVQAELFFGVPCAVPAFAFVDRSSGEILRMSHPDAAATIEARLSSHRSLLAGGSSYGNIYRAGAAHARFSVASVRWTDPFSTHHPLAVPALIALYAKDVLRAVLLLVREAMIAPGDLLGGLAHGYSPRAEFAFAPSRLAMAVAVRELIALAVAFDLAHGVPIVYADFLGYDEYGHRRGPRSRRALRSLRDIDTVIGRLVDAARTSPRRGYEVWIVSDHGQEPNEPYAKAYGRAIDDVVAEVLTAHGVGGHATVTGQGPVGHVYPSSPLGRSARHGVATALATEHGVPLVLAADGDGTALAWTSSGRWSLPADVAHVVGREHPYRDAVGGDLVRLAHHPDAGDLVLCGWSVGARAVNFAREQGSHGGPGPQETDAFALLPPSVGSWRGLLRPAVLREKAIDALRTRPDPQLPRRDHDDGTIRVVTYNIRGCRGLDGVTSPERIARVLAALDPDVVALQEVDVARARSSGIHQAQVIADRLEMLLHFHPTITVGEERYGDAVLSRLPMRVVRAAMLPRLTRRHPLEPRGAIWVEVDGPSSTLQLVNTHLSLHPAERGMQVDALLGHEWLGGMDRGTRAIAGDFNAMPWFPECLRIARELRDAQRARAGHRPRPTWPSATPVARIDHVYVDRGLAVAHVEVVGGSLPRVASDHLPLVVDVAPPR